MLLEVLEPISSINHCRQRSKQLLIALTEPIPIVQGVRRVLFRGQSVLLSEID